MPAEPVNVHKFTKRFLKNIKCVSALVPNSMESATNNRNLYNAMLAWLGTPDAWITANPNNKLNPIVLYLSSGKIFKFGDLSYLQKTTTCGNSPGTNSLHFLEFWKNLCEKVLGIDPKTMRPTKAGGILPRARHAANAFEEDGNASLHCHILVWFFLMDLSLTILTNFYNAGNTRLNVVIEILHGDLGFSIKINSHTNLSRVFLIP